MTLIAIQSDMSALERESCARVVVKRRLCPIHFVVTQLAVGGELCRRMRRVCGGVVILQMASHAGRGRAHKSLRMTQIATQSNMPTVQWESCGRVVVERTGLPGGLRMAGLAIGAEPCSGMHRVGGGFVILQVTGHTCGGSPRKSLGMTLIAIQSDMSALERESCA